MVGYFVVDPTRRNWSHLTARAPTDGAKPRRFQGTCPRSEWTARDSRKPPRTRAMNAQELLQEISDYCRQTGLAESTFGRRAVNDGKLASRLRHGGRITTETLDRIRGFMASNRNAAGRPAVIPRTQDHMPARPPESPSTPRPVDMQIRRKQGMHRPLSPTRRVRSARTPKKSGRSKADRSTIGPPNR